MILSHKDHLYQIEENDLATTIYKNNDAKTYTAIESIGKLSPEHFCVMHYIKVIRHNEAFFENRFLNRTSYLHDTPGFVALRVLRPYDPQNHYIILSLWDDRDSFEAWQMSSHYESIHKEHHQLKGLDQEVIDLNASYLIKFDIY
ncbi:antibiotic biosynthesis monooxygenase family protein [Staphylococcus coagulans]|uniref:antibiotic biosynthesis monooxygenase family protein n=2 Tax=Staphylococcus coagulans TaxID=74706 RepID=UPI001BE59100|nr:antibiotic biosynthesis monooxygenase [Staphylococcus coagulans]MBT2815196.1 antibiotic biosynthesis monooxygenase [Staphylococcus coagulans]MBT2817461.1 antibiotic biosynthesis monooxygenase [Staphylococcus coagulans]MBT2838185.1 antibiotic biosynthesis monooxygenase [Staphylococcus coagulans]MBT2842797.1 antibiotic biosynthesis monooxygenase [Staphylococcus coagulans]MBT2849409.1 antibiotic biosynthesis monooxygenase [Staphylococcus coagulans]